LCRSGRDRRGGNFTTETHNSVGGGTGALFTDGDDTSGPACPCGRSGRWALSADGQLTTLVTVRLTDLAPPAALLVAGPRGADAGLEFAADWQQGIDNATGSLLQINRSI